MKALLALVLILLGIAIINPVFFTTHLMAPVLGIANILFQLNMISRNVKREILKY
ncbi:MAG: hypothetical protein QXN55_01485 [Candidatus Nitrosotenuis sp.]